MSITTKGEVVYTCDVCKRKIRVSHNPFSIDIIQRCIITENCLGKLHPVTTIAEINSTPQFPPAVIGLQDWFQRKILFTFTQVINSADWIIPHNLGTKPVVELYLNTTDIDGKIIQVAIPPNQFIIEIIDLNTVHLHLSAASAGIAQCIGTSSENRINPILSTPVILVDKVLTNNGHLTIATTSPIPTIEIDLTYSSNQIANVSYIAVDNVPDNASPWVGTSVVHIGGKNFTVRSFNVVLDPLAPNFFNNGLIVNGSLVNFNNLGTTPGQNYILLGNSPFAVVDKILDTVIDIGLINTISPELYYSNGNFYAKPSILKAIYPPIFIVA